MEKNKTGKYFKYAIGEIVLVVIGILIALQINNWNTKRINANAERIILSDLKTELTTNITGLEKIISEHKKSLDAAIEIKTLIKDTLRLDSTSNKTLSATLQVMNKNWTYNPKLGILNATINSGRIDLIENKELKYTLASINEYIIDTNESTEAIENMREVFYWPSVASKRKIVDYENLNGDVRNDFNNSQFIFWTKYLIAMRKESLEEENGLLQFFENAKQQIESELSK